MKIEPIAAPTDMKPAGATLNKPMSSLERAKAAFMNPTTPTQQVAQSQSHPVSNPTSISPEESSVVRSQGYKGEEPKAASPEASTAETKTSSEPLSSQYAMLARKEKAIRQREQQLRSREAAIKAQAAPAAKAPEAAALDISKYVDKERLTKDPFTVLNELGLTYDQLTELALKAPSHEDMAVTNKLRALEDEIKSLKGETESTKKSFEDREKAQYNQAINQIRSDTRQLVQTDPNFEMIRETRSVSDVVELIERTFNEDGVLLSVEDAAQQVEDYLVDEAMKIARSKKIQQRLAPKTASVPQQTTAQPKQTQMKTLTNSVSASRPLSAKERALLAFEGKLTK